ncbi:MAG TPA: methyltransferase domain-containing protein [Terriglobia bacterium]|nr:methyltransferase domain-containing protein [Terriglobia bacterium]
MKKHRKAWFDNDVFWRDTYAYMFPESRFAGTAEAMEQVLQLTGIHKGSVLDLCCGPGRCSLALAAQGFHVTGVDRTKFLLDKAKAFSRAAHRKIEWVRADMREFSRANAFDLALSMYTSFGYFEDQSEDEQVLLNVFHSLRPGGVLLMELLGKEVLARIFQPSSAESLPDGSMIVEKRRIIDGWNRVENEWTIVRNGRVRRFGFQLRLYSGHELSVALKRSGFVDVKIYGDLKGSPYGPNASRLVAVGRKSGIKRK